MSNTKPDNKPTDRVDTRVKTKVTKQTQAQARGQELYMDRCRSCHLPINSHIKDGPRMEGLFERIPSDGFFKYFIRSRDSLKKSGDGYANAFDRNADIDYEHAFKDLTNKEIDDLAAYLKTP